MRAEPQKEKRETGADTIAEETSKTDEERKATHSESSANLRVNTGGKKKNTHRHILVKLMKSKDFFFPHVEPRFLQRNHRKNVDGLLYRNDGRLGAMERHPQSAEIKELPA